MICPQALQASEVLVGCFATGQEAKYRGTQRHGHQNEVAQAVRGQFELKHQDIPEQTDAIVVSWKLLIVFVHETQFTPSC